MKGIYLGGNMKKVYVVLGHYLSNSTSNESYSILGKYSIKSTLEKAQEELKLIKKEIIADYVDYNGLDINNLDIKETANSLEIVYGNEDIEEYKIEERFIDLED